MLKLTRYVTLIKVIKDVLGLAGLYLLLVFVQQLRCVLFHVSLWNQATHQSYHHQLKCSLLPLTSTIDHYPWHAMRQACRECKSAYVGMMGNKEWCLAGRIIKEFSYFIIWRRCYLRFCSFVSCPRLALNIFLL